MELSIMCFYVSQVELSKLFKSTSIPEVCIALPNSLDPNAMLHYATFHLGRHCMPNYTFRSHQLRMFHLITDVKFAKKKRPYACRFCLKRFPTPFQVARHERIHTGEKPYNCEYCGKLFTDKDNMKNHRLTHVIKKTLR